MSAPEEMKLAALADLLSEITGRDILGHARHYDRNAEARIAGAAVIFGCIRELLRRFDSPWMTTGRFGPRSGCQ